eukprot:1148597-Pelagomonas_calceolata.AAC.13
MESASAWPCAQLCACMVLPAYGRAGAETEGWGGPDVGVGGTEADAGRPGAPAALPPAAGAAAEGGGADDGKAGTPPPWPTCCSFTQARQVRAEVAVEHCRGDLSHGSGCGSKVGVAVPEEGGGEGGQGPSGRGSGGLARGWGQRAGMARLWRTCKVCVCVCACWKCVCVCARAGSVCVYVCACVCLYVVQCLLQSRTAVMTLHIITPILCPKHDINASKRSSGNGVEKFTPGHVNARSRPWLGRCNNTRFSPAPSEEVPHPQTALNTARCAHVTDSTQHRAVRARGTQTALNTVRCTHMTPEPHSLQPTCGAPGDWNMHGGHRGG